MNKTTDYKAMINQAIKYIETHITEDINVEIVAKHIYVSSFHFQRVFSLYCGVSVGEYIRNRRLTLAVNDLSNRKTVLDTALKYGYQAQESFSRAFKRFHGYLPSEMERKGRELRVFMKIREIKTKGVNNMKYKIETGNAITLVGFKKRFTGVPYGEQRQVQEREFAKTTRAKQWLLLGASCDYTTTYAVITNVDDTGFII